MLSLLISVVVFTFLLSMMLIVFCLGLSLFMLLMVVGGVLETVARIFKGKRSPPTDTTTSEPPPSSDLPLFPTDDSKRGFRPTLVTSAEDNQTVVFRP